MAVLSRMQGSAAAIWLRAWLLLILVFPAARAQEAAPGEYEVKAAFLFNFAKFVEWPPAKLTTNNAPIRFGVLGRSEALVGDLRKTLDGKLIDTHPVQLEFYEDSLPSDAPHILFVCKSERRNFRRIVNSLRGQPVLTVSEEDGFCEAGGMINFRLDGKKIRFEINQKAAEQNQLRMSSKLLRVALRIVETQD